MKVRLAGFTLAIVLLGVSAAPAASRPRRAHDSRPPRDLHLVGDHWTAWNPPTPDPGVQVYVIARGDTLWDLAKRFYGNPYLWPQLWEKNQYILDAHWIYPGDPLVTGIQVAPAQTLAQAGGGEGAGPASGGGPAPLPPPEVTGVESAGRAASAPVPLGAESDIYCSGWIGDAGQQFPYTIVGSEFDNLVPRISFRERHLNEITGPSTAKVDMFTGDIVYLSGGSVQGLTPGSVFTIVGAEQPVVHPLTNQVFGSFYPYRGRVRVLSVQESTAIGEIIFSCDSVQLGDRLRPFEPEPVPLGRQTAMRPINLPATPDHLKDAPCIIYSYNIISLGQDHVAFIDRGSDQNVTPGDVYTLYRMSDAGMPPLVLGEVAVLSVQKRTSLVRILQSLFPVYVGDRLDPK